MFVDDLFIRNNVGICFKRFAFSTRDNFVLDFPMFQLSINGITSYSITILLVPYYIINIENNHIVIDTCVIMMPRICYIQKQCMAT